MTRARSLNFNPLPSYEGRQDKRITEVEDKLFQSTPLIRGETMYKEYCEDSGTISIHSPHARGDGRARWSASRDPHFNPLPSCEGRQKPRRVRAPLGYFNPLPSYEGRPITKIKREGTSVFQSTPLMRGETLSDRKIFPVSPISIHSPHTRGDDHTLTEEAITMNFNPLPSHEGRRDRDEIGRWKQISIHSPHTRGDRRGAAFCRVLTDFNPLPSHEGRPPAHPTHTAQDAFQSTPLTRGETKLSYILLTFPSYFNPLPSHEGRPFGEDAAGCGWTFQSTPLTRGETSPLAKDG